MSRNTFDVTVVGAGCFGAWSAYELCRAGRRVLLLDAWGPAHSRASSGGESRVIRMGYGRDELYTRWSLRSLAAWKELAERVRLPLFRQTGMLWLTGADDEYARRVEQTLGWFGVENERLSRRELQSRFPQIAATDIEWALWEPGSGALMARQSVQALVTECVRLGVEYRTASVLPPSPDAAVPEGAGARLGRIATSGGESIAAGQFVFACGPWLPKLFPDLLGARIFPSRQEIYFFAPPPGDASFAPPAMPCWYHHPALMYGIPDLDRRGFKISIDRHGPAFDPDAGSRLPSVEGIALVRSYLAQRFPKLADAPLTETRVCQYENTSNGDFIIDRHPDLDDVLIAGGGSGHGFKHGPAVGAYVRDLLAGTAAPEQRFALSSKQTAQARSVY